MTIRELTACRKRFETFAGDMLGSLRDRRQGQWAQVYLRGLLLEGRRKSCQPMAERVPDGDEQCLQQFLNQSPWEWAPVRQTLASTMTGLLLAAGSRCLSAGGCWIVDDTGFPKQGRHSVGVARQYSGTLGKTGNCQIGVSISAASGKLAMPLDWALYLPEEWCDDRPRCERAGVPAGVSFQPKWQLALGLMDDLLSWGVPAPEVVVADAAYGSITEFRQGLTARQLRYAVEVEHTLVVWTEPQRRVTPMRQAGQTGRPRAARYQETPQSLKAIALSLPASAWRQVTWREGTKGPMRSRFARLRVQPAHGWQQGAPELPVVWLLIEWPEGAGGMDAAEGAAAPSKYWLSDLSEGISLRALVRLAKSRWAVEMNYREMKDHLGLDHFEGRGWAGWHHHVTLVMLAFAFVLSERLRQSKRGRTSRFPRSWAGCNDCSPPGAASASPAASRSCASHGIT